MSVLTKLRITGIIEVKTGLHIGGSDAFSAIGAVSSPVIRDSLTKKPIIPGSTLKGKMRYLLVRARSESNVLNEPNDDPEEILRLFGNSKTKPGERLMNSRLKFSDSFMKNYSQLKERVDTVTEIKFENTISRTTAVANPRQIERVIKGAEFDFEIIYDAEYLSQVEEDFKLLREGLNWIENDYLGGGGSRGSGRVSFKEPTVSKAFGEIDDSYIKKCNDILGDKK
jgi:CRISPR-associated protein Csm3